MNSPAENPELVFIISSVPDQQKWVLLHEKEERHFRDRSHGKVPGLVDAIRHAFLTADGRTSLLLIQHGGRQFRLRFHAEGLLENGPLPGVRRGVNADTTALNVLCAAS